MSWFDANIGHMDPGSAFHLLEVLTHLSDRVKRVRSDMLADGASRDERMAAAQIQGDIDQAIGTIQRHLIRTSSAERSARLGDRIRTNGAPGGMAGDPPPAEARTHA